MTHEEMATWLETWGEAALNISEGERLREIAAEFRRMHDQLLTAHEAWDRLRRGVEWVEGEAFKAYSVAGLLEEINRLDPRPKREETDA